MEVMAWYFAGAGMSAEPGGGKQILPGEFGFGIWVFAFQGGGNVDSALPQL